MDCDVSGCKETAEWLCIESQFKYCATHKHPHGEPPHRYKKVSKPRRLPSNKNDVQIAEASTSF